MFSMTDPIISRLLFDASTEFPYASSTGLGVAGRQTTAQWAETPPVFAALGLVSPAERDKVLKYYHPRDAALALASILLKHLALAEALSLPWASTPVTQERDLHNGRPFYAPGGLDFNVSHHGSLAVLAATTFPGIHVGIDIVEVNVEKDAHSIQNSNGWRAWSSIFSEAFTMGEIDRIHAAVPLALDASITQTSGALQVALRTFHGHWALKEAYIKMTSEAFMATWLQELEFRNVRIPHAASSDQIAGDQWATGEIVTNIEVWLKDTRVADVHVELQAVGASYMVATASNKAARINAPQHVKVSTDIQPLASQSMQT